MKSSLFCILIFACSCHGMLQRHNSAEALIQQRARAHQELLERKDTLFSEHRRVATGMVVGSAILLLADPVERTFPWFGFGLRLCGSVGMLYGVSRSIALEEAVETLGNE